LRLLFHFACFVTVSLTLAPHATFALQAAATTAAAQSPALPAHAEVKGGTVHGQVKAANVPLPGVGITATNTLTGKKFSTTTDVNGAFAMVIPQNGRYVLKTDLAGFAAATKEVLLNASSHDQQVELTMELASRAQAQDAKENASAARQYSGSGAQNLNLLGAVAGAIQAGALSNSEGGTQLPTVTGNTDFSGESVAVNGQAGTTNPFAGVDMNQMRENMENQRQQQGLSQVPGQSGGGGGGFGGGGGGGFGGGPGGPGGGGRGFGNFRNFKPSQPHGAIFWNGGNSALNAEPYSLQGLPSTQPGYASNRFGLTIFAEPYIPKVTKPSTKSNVFLTLYTQRVSTPFDQYATVPTDTERLGDFSNFTDSQGNLIPIYDPRTRMPFPDNKIPVDRLVEQAESLLNFVPQQNLPGSLQNYRRQTTAQNDSTTLGFRYMRTIGGGSGQQIPAFLAQFSNSKGLRQNLSLNFNYSHAASDRVNIFSDLGGKLSSDSYALTLGYTLGFGKLTNNFSAGWNYAQSQLTNFYTGTQDIATQIGILGPDGGALNASPLNYGVPSIVLSEFTGLNETQPNFRLTQTISLSDSSSWLHGKHNFRFGGDFRRVHLNLLGGTNATGTFYFTGYATQAPGSAEGGGTGNATTTSSGSALADMLLSRPQESTIQAPQQKAYMRANVWDAFIQDDFRVLPNLTILAGLRYEYFSPYSETNDRLVNLDPNSDFSEVTPVYPNGVGPVSGKYPRSLIEPYWTAFSPRIGFALRPMKNTVVRGGFGINFTTGQYANFIQDLAYQPPFANVQTNQVTQLTVISLENGFPAPQTVGNFGVYKNYTLPYVEVWNMDIQRTLLLGIVLNVGYNGAKGTHLDITSAPGRTALESTSGVYFNWEDSLAFSNFNALAVRARKRLQNGVSMGVTYTYSHSIDNAGSIGGTSTVVAQNWQDLVAEEGNSSFDVRQKATGDYLFELPLGPDKRWLSGGGWASHAFSNVSLSGDFTFATGTPLTPRYAAAAADVARGTAGSLRPDLVPGVSVTAGGGSATRWFNPEAFTSPAQLYGNASRNSIAGPGIVTNDMSLAKTLHLGETRSLEMRATANNVFNTVQYATVDSEIDSRTVGQVTSTATMRQFSFMGRFRF
jgi:trimeric autotransporter adhesin